MPVPDCQSLMLPVLRPVSDGTTHKSPELSAAVAEALRLRDDDLAELLPSGKQTTFFNRSDWARFLLVCAVCLLLAGGCGGDGDAEPVEEATASPTPQASSTSQLTTYRNEEWGFALEYPAEWNEGDPPTNYDFAIAFASVAKLGEMTEAERKDARAVWVNVERLPEPGTESDFRMGLEGMAAGLEDATAESPETGDPSLEVTHVEMGEFAGLPCLIVDMTLTVEYLGGSLWHQRSYIFGQDDLLYYLNLYGVEDRWAKDKASLESIAQSFVLL